MSCVNTKSKEFIETAKRLDLSSGTLELIVHEFQNTEGNEEGFPSDAYILERVRGESMTNASEDQAKLWESKYSNPITANTLDAARQVAAEASKYFPKQSIKVHGTYDGKYKVTVARPFTEAYVKEIQTILRNAPRDSQGRLLAPNGEPSNLTEQQYAQVRTKAFINWFGDWINDPENASKVVDENGEPLIVYHGGAKNITEFRSSLKDSSNTGYGYYVDKTTGEKIPIDSNRAIFFSDNRYVGQSYADIYAVNYFRQLKYKINSLVKTFYGGKASINKEVFKSINDLYDFLEIISEYNPRFLKLRDYIQNLQKQGQKIKPNEVEAARKLFIETSKFLDDYTSEWNLNISEWNNILNTAASIINRYNSESGIEKLLNGEIPRELLREWEIYKKIENHREKQGLSKIANYERVHLFLCSDFGSSYTLEYAGETLLLSSPQHRNIPISELSKEEIKEFLEDAKLANKYEIDRRNNRNIATQFRDKSQEYAVFLNMRNPLAHDYEGTHQGQKYKFGKYPFGYVAARQVNKAINEHYDGVIYENLYDPYLANNYGVFNPNQIKSATDNITFSTEDNNIYNEGEIVSFNESAADVRLKSLYEQQSSKEVTIGDLLSIINESSEYYPIVKMLASEKSGRGSLLTGVKVKIDDTIVSPSAKTKYNGRRAYYDAETKTVHINASALFNDGKADSVIMHEVLHAITVDRILSNPTLRADFQSIIDDFLRENPQYRYRYGKNEKHAIEEFIADVWSNPTVIEALKNTKSSRDTNLSLWDRIKNFFTGIFKGVSSDSLFAEASVKINELLNIPSTVNSTETFFEGEQDTYKKPMTIDEKHHQMSIELKSKLDNLMNSDLLTVTEIRAIAEDIAYFVSDTISDLHDNPEKLYENFPDKRTLDKEGNWTEENKNRDFNKAMMMTRLELVNFISPANLMNLCKEAFNKSTSMRTGKKVRFIKNNWSAFVSLGSSIFSSLEKFNIGDTLAESVDDSVNSADPNSEKDEDEIKELTGNLQEHWQTKVTTQKVVNTMSQLMKQVIRSLLDIDENGNPKVSEYGRPKRVNFKNAINSITYWVVGSTNIQDMVDKLRIQAKEHPWVNQLITKLTDTSGNEALFQSQFFSTFNLAQQSYSIVEKIDNKYVAKPVNETPALKDAIDTITTLYKMNIHPLFDTRGNVDIEQMKKLVSLYEELKNIEKLNDSNTEHAINIITSILNLLGHSSTSKEIKSSINNNIIARTVELLDSIIKTTRENFRKATYAPFTFKGDGNITSYVKNLISPFIANREAIIEKATYSDGEMHQTHVLHSYLTKLMDKFKLEGDKFEEFLLNTYDIPWFKDPNKYEFGEGWKNVWLKMLATNKEARKVFKHAVVLNFNKKNYMKNMTESEYLLEILAMYNSESGKGDLVPAWFRIPMMSNKPSSEFLRFYSYRGSGYRESIVSGIYQIFLQELGRIQAVKMRKNAVSKDDKIKNFDKNGEKFCFLNYLNSYLIDGSELGTLINRKVNGEQLSPDETTKLMLSAKEAIRSHMYSYVKMVKQSWENAGILKVANDTISGFDADNFIWNDTFAAMNILQLTITDISFYKDAEDLQKRLAQIHAPGARCNIYATDFNGNRVSDGISRTLIINDFKGLVSNIVENVKIVYDKKIANAKTEEERNSLKILRDYLVKDPVYNEDGSVKEQGVFYDINLTDAQAYNSPTSYRKKAIMFGKWGKSQEELYQKIISGKATYSDLQVMFQPLKPFVYSQKRVDLGITEGMTSTNVPFQCKNSEYLLILADAIIQGENTGKPNLLRVLYEIMEESATENNRKGIDTIQFDSAIKSGLSGSVDLSSFMSMENGEEKAKEYLESLIYKDKTTEYNKTYIHEFPFEDFCLQQEVPAHFRNHEQAHGSQERYIVISDLENTDNEGNKISYNVRGQQLTKAQIQERYEKLISENIEDALQELSKELHLDSINKKDRNIALSRVLVKEILDNPRYGVDLLYACLVDENGDFNIPLGDPIQAKRVEQLLNSIIKNRVNKQTIAGGPVVQVSNFGTSRELNIVFKSKELDENGNNKLLKTRKEFNGTDAEYKEYITKNQAGIAYFEVFAPVYMKETLSMFINPDGTIDIEAIEATDPDLLKMIGYRIPTEDKYSISPLKIVGFLPREAGEGIMLPADITLLTGSDFDVDKEYLMIKKLDIITKPTNTIFWSMYHALKQGKKYAEREALKEEIGDFLSNIEMMKSTYPELWNTYKKVAYKTTEPKSVRDRRNNEILDITYAIMSHETVADQVLNPGNFEPQKKMGYLVEALRTTGMSYGKLSNMTVEELKEYATKNKNLSFIDVHTQFYKQNSAAGSLIGTFAVHKVGHAVLEGNGFKLKVLDACGATEPFEIAGMTFTDSMEIDPTKNSKGELIGKVLGSLVASSVDAVKDPILNLMNINKNTSGILATLVRLGMPFEDAALFLSQKAVTELLQEYESKAVNEYTSLNKELENKITKLTKDASIGASSELFKMPILKEDLITGITESSPEHTLKILKAFQRISLLAAELRTITFATRFNSITNAVGPLVIDTLMLEHNMEKFSEYITDADDNYVTMENVFEKHPILKSFANTIPLASRVLSDMLTGSSNFRSLIHCAGDTVANKLLSDRKILSKLGDFYQSYLLVASGVIDSSEIEYYISEFPKEFFATIKTNPKYSDNLLIQAIKPQSSKKTSRIHLNIDTSGMDNESKDPLMSSWTDLHKTDPELALKLFKYCFFRGGIGYNPKTFMHLVSVFFKKNIPNYINTFKNKPSVVNINIIDQFVRNNWDDNKLVPRKKAKGKNAPDGILFDFTQSGTLRITDPGTVLEMKNTPYFKMKMRGVDVILKMIINEENRLEYSKVQPLGNNGEYLELSTGQITKPISITEECIPDDAESEVQDISKSETEESMDIPQEDMELSAYEKALSVIELDSNITNKEDAVQKLQEYRNKSKKEQEELENSMINYITKKMASLGLSTSPDEVQSVYNEFTKKENICE